ncbi:MAG: ATP phosphoribosyltransferase [Acidobacteriota bacterium]
MAVPTGRLLAPSRRLLEQAGWKLPHRLGETRRLILEAGRPRTRFILVKPADVPVYVEHGIADAGIAGADVLWESAADVLQPLDLPIGHCRMVVAGPNGRGLPADVAVLRVATKYPRLTREYFHARGQHVEVIALGGSVELAPLLGLADVVVDVMETGTTLRENGLTVLEQIGPVSARWIVNRARLVLRRAEIERMTERLAQAARALGSGR